MHTQYMKRAIELAKEGMGYTSPNPLVGAVIVKKNRIIGEGYHEYYGGPHAEINAFKNATEDVKGSTMYVTLEPCSHFGKTPPCADAIVKNEISRVIIAMKDPNSLVSGRGIKILEKNGIEVASGILEDEAKEINEVFIKYITTKLPFCILKTAMTLDGKISTVTGDSKWITNEASREFVHRLRHRLSAIMVGIGTVLADNPELTTRLRDIKGVNPTRVIVDTRGRIPLESKILNTSKEINTIIATTERANKAKVQQIKDKGASIIITPLKDERVDLVYLMKSLGERKIDSLLLEGGSTLNYSFIAEGLVDKVVSFIAPRIIGGREAKTPIGGEGIKSIGEAITINNINIERFNGDIMIEGYIRKEDR